MRLESWPLDGRATGLDYAAEWDAMVIGAGPAGSVAAGLLAGRGWRVLLAERAQWPREKACGGCLNAAAVGMLRRMGMAEVLDGAMELREMTVQLGRQRLSFGVPAGAAVERAELDARLVVAAERRGCVFLPETVARVIPDDGAPWRGVQLVSCGQTEVVRARVVLACDGIKGNSLAGETWARAETERRVRLGFAATVRGAAVGDAIPQGRVGMFVGPEGYVGLARLGAGRAGGDWLHVGAALAPEACHARRGPLELIGEILDRCGMRRLEGLEGVAYCGTGPLTVRRRAVAGRRVLVVGDACGYVEPFTGEGISWAIRGACEAVSVLPTEAGGWRDELASAWQARYERTIRRRQRWCRGLRACSFRPLLSAGILRAARMWPILPRLLAEHISRGESFVETDA